MWFKWKIRSGTSFKVLSTATIIITLKREWNHAVSSNISNTLLILQVSNIFQNYHIYFRGNFPVIAGKHRFFFLCFQSHAFSALFFTPTETKQCHQESLTNLYSPSFIFTQVNIEILLIYFLMIHRKDHR